MLVPAKGSLRTSPSGELVVSFPDCVQSDHQRLEKWLHNRTLQTGRRKVQALRQLLR